MSRDFGQLVDECDLFLESDPGTGESVSYSDHMFQELELDEAQHIELLEYEGWLDHMNMIYTRGR